MKRLFSRYRTHLIRQALPLSGVGLVHEAGYQGAPWLILPLMTAGICWLAGVPDGIERWLVGVSVGLAAAGYGIVVWEFLVVPVRNDVKRARGKSQGELD